KGWKYGITPIDKIEKLIKAVQNNDPSLKVVIEARNADGDVDRAEKGIAFNLCAPMWGNGHHKVVYERGTSALAPHSINTLMTVFYLVDKEEDTRFWGFEQVDPYAKYKEKFSHIVNLARRDDSLYLWGIASTKTPTRYMRGINSDSPCHRSRGDYMYTTYNHILYADVEATVDGTAIEGIATLGGRNTVVHPNASADTIMHEFGHLFAGLLDESGGKGGITLHQPEKNCTFDPVSDFAYEGRQYGAGAITSVRGCNHVGGSPLHNIYRPSPTGLMNYDTAKLPRDNRLSAVDCGFAIAATIGGKGPEYFPECMGLNVIKSTGASALLPRNPLLASISNAAPAGQFSEPAETDMQGGVIFERDTPSGDIPAAGVVWYDGEPMPPSLKFLEAPSTASVIERLRARVRELTTERNTLRTRRRPAPRATRRHFLRAAGYSRSDAGGSAIRAESFGFSNSKFEYRNSKQYLNPNVPNSKQFRLLGF
ncbi:MAG: hypothetical protein HYW65_00385, partial [Candidatus Liptonbacteria bacterium]|nr:hypothetical protein [Candidatus Liptonbacteria bacterium]